MSIFIRAAAILTGVGLTGLAAHAVALRTDTEDLVRVAAFAEIGETVSDEAFGRARAAAMALAAEGTCEPHAIRAGTSMIMIDLDRRLEAGAEPDRALLKDAETYLAHALRCAPADGNLWARLALVGQALGLAPEAQARVIAAASARAPAEPAPLAARIVFWVGADAATRSAGRATLRSDLTTLLAHAAPSEAVALLAEAPADMQGDVLAVLAALPPDRRAALVDAGFRWLGRASGGDLELRSGI